MGSKFFGKQMRPSIPLGKLNAGSMDATSRGSVRRRCDAVSNAVQQLEKRVLFAFTAGDIAVERIGDGSAALTSAATPVFIDEYAASGAGQTSALSLEFPTTTIGTTNALTDNGGSNSVGFLTLSADGKYLIVPGYGLASGTSSVSGTNTHVVGRVDALGTTDTTTAYTSSNSVRGAAASTGSGFYISGSGSGVQYVPYGNTTATAPVQISNTSSGTGSTTTTLRTVSIYNGQLYADAASSTGLLYGPGTVGSGLPTTGPQTITVLPGFGTNTTGSPYPFVFANSTTLYVADSNTSGIGGIQKWTLSAGTWTKQYSALFSGTGVATADQGMLGIAIDASGNIYGTTSGFSANRLVKVTDTGSGFTYTTLATAATNEQFHGVALAPTGFEVGSVTATPNSILTGSTITLTASNVINTIGTGTVSSVAFYLEHTAGTQSSANDTLVGNANLSSGTSSAGTWTLNSVTTPATAGTYYYYAVATSNTGGTTGFGAEPTAPLLINSTPAPTITSVSVTGNPAGYDDATTKFTATGVASGSDNSPIASVNFYKQLGPAPSSGDTLIGSGTPDGSGNYNLTLTPSSKFAVGTYTIYAVATTAAGASSLAASTLFTVNVPKLSFNASTYSINENAGTVTIYVDRTGDIADAATVAYATSNTSSGALPGVNYGTLGNTTTQVTGTLSFAAGVAQTSFTIPILEKQPQSGNKAFTVTLSNPQDTSSPTIAGALGSNSTTSVTILDYQENYNSSGSISVNQTSGFAEFSVARTGFVNDAATIAFNTANGTAISGTNFGVAGTTGTYTGSITFAANASIGVASVPIINAGATSNLTFSIVLLAQNTQTDTAGKSVNTNGDYEVIGSANTATATIVSTTATSVTNTLTGYASSATGIETSGNYLSGYAPVVGDSTAGSSATGNSSFGFNAYQILEFSQSATPSIYPALGTTVNTAANSIPNLSLEMYNSAATGAYAGHVGNFDLYYILDSDSTTPTSGLKYNGTAGVTNTGLNSSQFTMTPVLLGTFSFSNNPVGDDTFTTSTIIPAAVQTSLETALNTGANFRFAVTPAATGVGAIAADWSGVFNTESPQIQLSAAETQNQVPEYLAFSQTAYNVSEGGTATITLTRTGPTADTATVHYALSNGSGVAGVNYTGASGTATFSPGASTTTFTVSTTAVANQGGDKTVNLTLSSPTNSNTATYIAGVGSPSTAVLTINDNNDAGATTETIGNNAFNVADVEKGGPYTATEFKVEGTSGGSYPSYAVADFNSTSAYTLTGPANITPAHTVTAITGITLTIFNIGGGTSGPIDFFLVPDSTSNITPGSPQGANPHFFDSTNFPVQGLDTRTPTTTYQNSFGTPVLLDAYNWIASSASPDSTFNIPLTGFSQATENMLIADLNSGSTFRIVAVPESASVYALWGGVNAYTNPTTSATVDEAPYIAFNLTETTNIPAWLAPGSSAVWSNTPGGTLVVTGAATIIGDPGTDEPNITFTGSGDVLTIQPPPGSLIHLGSLNISGGAIVKVVAPAAESDVLIIASTSTGLTIDPTSQLDLGSSDLIVQGGSVSAISAYIAAGYNGDLWNGLDGIISSAAASNASQLTTLGVIPNTTPQFVTFDGVSVATTDVLVKYTYYGDTNLDGKVDGSDYSRIDNGKLLGLTGWYNGDLNYDGVINGSDYTLLDNAYNTQGGYFAPLTQIASATPAESTAVPLATVATDSLFSKKKVKHSLVFDDLVTH